MTPIAWVILAVFVLSSLSLAATSYMHGRSTGYRKGKRRGAYESRWCYDVVVFDADGTAIGEDTARPGDPGVVEEAYGMKAIVLPGYEGDDGETELPSETTVYPGVNVSETPDEDPRDGVDA